MAHLISEAVRWGTRILCAQWCELKLSKFVFPASTAAVGGRTSWATRPMILGIPLWLGAYAVGIKGD